MLAYAFSVLNNRNTAPCLRRTSTTRSSCAPPSSSEACPCNSNEASGREYVSRTEARSSLRGKIEVTDSVKSQAILRRQLVCSYDEFSVDTTMNRVIKATVTLLVRSDISKVRKKSLKKLMVFFADVREIDLHTVDWNMRYDRNNRTYRMLMAVCWLVVEGYSTPAVMVSLA